MMSQLWDEDAASMKTPYRTLHSKLRDLCPHCRNAPAREETGLCERCEQNAQADADNVIDLDEERDTRKAERIYSGELE